MFDAIDLEILRLLRENSKFSNKEIGEKIHLTGQAVGVRISRLMDDNLINRFTIEVNHENLGASVSYIKVYKAPDQAGLEAIIEDSIVEDCYEVFSENCYLLRTVYYDKGLFDQLIERISASAMYQVTHIDKKIK